MALFFFLGGHENMWTPGFPHDLHIITRAEATWESHLQGYFVVRNAAQLKTLQKCGSGEQQT